MKKEYSIFTDNYIFSIFLWPQIMFGIYFEIGRCFEINILCFQFAIFKRIKEWANPVQLTMTNNIDFTKVSLFLIMSRLKKIITDELESMGISPQFIDSDSILPNVPIRNILIRQEFFSLHKKGEKSEKLFCDLAVKYDLEYQTIINIIYSK